MTDILTEKQMNLMFENAAYKASAEVSDKIEALGDKIFAKIDEMEATRLADREQERHHYEEKRNAFFHSATGTRAEDVSDFRKDVDFVRKQRIDSENNTRKVKDTLITISVPLALGGIGSWIVTFLRGSGL